MSQNGKGSKPRPLSISYSEYSDRYDYIFRNKDDAKTKLRKKIKKIKNENSS